VFFCSESLKKTRKHNQFDDFRPLSRLRKAAGVTTTTDNRQQTTNNRLPTTTTTPATTTTDNNRQQQQQYRGFWPVRRKKTWKFAVFFVPMVFLKLA
jgi:hypothetical protein